MSFTAEEKAKCALREIALRRNVYARRVRAGYMKQSEADREIALMEEIAADYVIIAQKEKSDV